MWRDGLLIPLVFWVAHEVSLLLMNWVYPTKIMNGSLMEINYTIGEIIMRFGTLHTILLISICLNFQLNYSQDEELDLEVLWENTIWEEIQEVTDLAYEVEIVTPVAGVRGAEAEDEALEHLYYRKSMKGISLDEYKKAYGKLKIKRDELFKQNKNNIKLKKMDNLLSQLRNKIKNS